MIDEKFINYLDEITSGPVRKADAALTELVKNKQILLEHKNDFVLWLGKPVDAITTTVENSIYLNEELQFVDSENLPRGITYYRNSNAFIGAISAQNLTAAECRVVFRSLIMTQDSTTETDIKASRLISTAKEAHLLRKRLPPSYRLLLDEILFLSATVVYKDNRNLISELVLKDGTDLIFLIPQGHWKEEELVHYVEEQKAKYSSSDIFLLLFSEEVYNKIYDLKGIVFMNFWKRDSVQDWANENNVILDLEVHYDRYIGYLGGEPSNKQINKNSWPCVEIAGEWLPLNFYGSVMINDEQLDLFAGINNDRDDGFEEPLKPENGWNAAITTNETPPWVKFLPLPQEQEILPLRKVPYIEKKNPPSTKFLEPKDVRKLKPVYTISAAAMKDEYFAWGDAEDLVIFYNPKKNYYCIAPTLY